MPKIQGLTDAEKTQREKTSRLAEIARQTFPDCNMTTASLPAFVVSLTPQLTYMLMPGRIKLEFTT